jgi:hypothetical protein
MQPVKQLVRVVHGSHLYGTSTPASDRDYKGVHLPSGEAIILQRAENVIDTSVVIKDAAGKNQAESVDNQSFSLQNFFAMLAKGDTVATEILFAPPAEVCDPCWWKVQEIGEQLLNRQCKGFVGYCQRQAAKYGIKGSRMSAVKDLRDLLATIPPAAKLAAYEPVFRTHTEGKDHMLWENIPHPDGRTCWHINCCDRKMPMTATAGEAFKVYDKVWENYGERARQAMTNEGIDWKAVSHAVRVARQAIELLSTGKLTFPRPDAAELLDIKLGRIPYSEVSPMLEALVQQVQNTESFLPETTDLALADRVVTNFYKWQLR